MLPVSVWTVASRPRTFVVDAERGCVCAVNGAEASSAPDVERTKQMTSEDVYPVRSGVRLDIWLHRYPSGGEIHTSIYTRFRPEDAPVHTPEQIARIYGIDLESESGGELALRASSIEVPREFTFRPDCGICWWCGGAYEDHREEDGKLRCRFGEPQPGAMRLERGGKRHER